MENGSEPDERRRRTLDRKWNPFHRKTKLPAIQIPLKLQYGNEQSANRVQTRPIPEGTDKFSKQNKALEQIRDFIADFQWDTPAPNFRPPGMSPPGGYPQMVAQQMQAQQMGIACMAQQIQIPGAPMPGQEMRSLNLNALPRGHRVLFGLDRMSSGDGTTID